MKPEGKVGPAGALEAGDWVFFCVTKNVLGLLSVSSLSSDTSKLAFERGHYRSTNRMTVPESRAHIALGLGIAHSASRYHEWGSRVCVVCPSAQEKWGSHDEGQLCVHSAALWMLTAQRFLPFGKMPSPLSVRALLSAE